MKLLRLLMFALSARHFIWCGPSLREDIEAFLPKEFLRGTTATWIVTSRDRTRASSAECTELAQRQNRIVSPKDIVGMLDNKRMELLEILPRPSYKQCLLE